MASVAGMGGQISFNGRGLPCPKAVIGRRVAPRATETDDAFDLRDRRRILSRVDLRDTAGLAVPTVPEPPSTAARA